MAALSLIAAAACTKNEFDSQNVQNNEGRTVLTVEPSSVMHRAMSARYFGARETRFQSMGSLPKPLTLRAMQLRQISRSMPN